MDRRSVRHRHHIVPKHDGGTDDPLNLTPPISRAMHAVFHYDRWKVLGQVEDRVAWLALSGRVSEASRLLQLEGCRQGGLISGPKRRGAKVSDTAKAKQRAKMLGRKATPETRARLSAAKKGKKQRPRSVPVWNKGRKLTETHRANLRAAHLGTKLRSEHAANIRAALQGRVFSDEHRAKLSAATTEWHARRKANQV